MKKPKPEERRIYILVPQSVDITKGRKTYSIEMEPGRLMAQCAHVARKMETACHAVEYNEITTIVLSVRNSRELEFMYWILSSRLQTEVHRFEDLNPAFYETHKRVLTAICTEAVLPSTVAEYLGHLPLYGSETC